MKYTVVNKIKTIQVLWIATLFLVLSSIITAAPVKKNDFIHGYNSSEGGLEQESGNKNQAKIYSQLQIEGLRQAVSPRYVRVISFKANDKQGRILKKGILFTIAAYRARNITISGDFNNWGLIAMQRGTNGVYYYILPVLEVELGRKILDYEYKFQVDGMWTWDKSNKNRRDDGLGGYTSVYHLPEFDSERKIKVRILREERTQRERLIEFAIYKPTAQNLSLVGDFNNWNPEMDPMSKGKDGIFRLRKRFKNGVYLYKYVIDGRWVLDKYNQETRFHSGLEELTSYIKIK